MTPIHMDRTTTEISAAADGPMTLPPKQKQWSNALHARQVAFHPSSSLKPLIFILWDDQDWFHESCLHLRARTTVGSHPQNQDAKDEDDDDDDEDEENDPNLFLKPSEYESLICGACVRKSPVLSRWAGTPGARMMVWRTSASASGSGMGEAHCSKPSGQWPLFGKDATQHEDALVDIEGLGNQLIQSPTAALPTF